jgi:hypothetical protein
MKLNADDKSRFADRQKGIQIRFKIEKKNCAGLFSGRRETKLDSSFMCPIAVCISAVIRARAWMGLNAFCGVARYRSRLGGEREKIQPVGVRE